MHPRGMSRACVLQHSDQICGLGVLGGHGGVQGWTDFLQPWFTWITLLWCPTHVCFVFLGFSPLASGRLKITEAADNKSARHTGLWPPIRRQWDHILCNCHNGESGEGVGEGHTLLVLILRDNRSCLAIGPSFSFIWSQGHNVALFSVSKAIVRPQSGPRRTPPGRVNTHPEVAGDNGEWSFLFLQEEMFFPPSEFGNHRPQGVVKPPFWASVSSTGPWWSAYTPRPRQGS